MRIIDAHMHFSDIRSFRETAKLYSGVDYSYEGYERESADCGIEFSICMGLAEGLEEFPDRQAATPMAADLDARTPDKLRLCPGINPHRLEEACLTALERAARGGKIAGFKLYAGYYHFNIYDEVYDPVYRMAMQYGLPVVIHTGDTYSERGLLEYARPLAADRIALKYRELSVVLCHLGDPWIMEACEVAHKNRNVRLDMSGLLVGDRAVIAETEARELLMSHYKQGLLYLNDYKKLLFGTDWPLAPMGAYIDFCKKLVHERHYNDVFYNNAAEIFGL